MHRGLKTATAMYESDTDPLTDPKDSSIPQRPLMMSPNQRKPLLILFQLMTTLRLMVHVVHLLLCL